MTFNLVRKTFSQWRISSSGSSKVNRRTEKVRLPKLLTPFLELHSFSKCLLAGFLLLAPWSLIPVFATGLDTTASTITIDYDQPAVANLPSLPALDCFGHSNPDTDLILSFSAFGLDGDFGSDLNECFRQAGTYNVRVHLEDAAGNTTDRDFVINIKPDQIDFNNSTIDERYDPAGADEPTANNRDYYEFQMFLRDALGNPVYQVTGGRVSSPTVFDDDANLGVSFRDALRLNDGSELPAVEPAADNVTDTNLSDGLNFQVRSLAPSLVSLANQMGVLGDREMVMRFAFAQVLPDGSLSPTETQSILPTKTMRFHPIFRFKPSLPTFIYDNQPVFIDIEITTFGDTPQTPDKPDTVRIYSPTNNVEFFTPDITGTADDPASGHDFTTNLPAVIAGINFGLNPTVNGVVDNQLRVVTEVTYSLGGETIKYPS